VKGALRNELAVMHVDNVAFGIDSYNDACGQDDWKLQAPILMLFPQEPRYTSVTPLHLEGNQ